MRVYLPVTWPQLAGIGESGLDAGTWNVVVPASADEGDEYDALCTAAEQSREMALSHGTRPRRVVVALDVESTAVDAEHGSTRVRGPFPLRAVAAVLADDAAAEASAQAGEALDDHELGWWATQEIGDLLSS